MDTLPLTLQQVHNEVPFGRWLGDWLALYDVALDHMVGSSRRYDLHYLAWETVRKGRNPYFVQGTGFEGYLVGACRTPEEALDILLDTSQAVLNRIARLYRHNYRFRAQLMKVLRREQGDVAAMNEWSAQLGATIGQMRCRLLTSPNAQDFQRGTYQVVSSLPPIRYWQQTDALAQVYSLRRDTQAAHQLRIDLTLLKPSTQDAWLVAESIGAFGHPLVREYLARQPWRLGY